MADDLEMEPFFKAVGLSKETVMAKPLLTMRQQQSALAACSAYAAELEKSYRDANACNEHESAAYFKNRVSETRDAYQALLKMDTKI